MNEKEINVVDLDKPHVEVENNTNNNSEPVEQYKAKRAFAIIGFICGICGLVLSLVGGVGLFVNIPGLVFSSIGKKSTTKANYAKKGVKLNTIGIIVNAIISIFTFILWIVIMVGLMEKGL